MRERGPSSLLELDVDIWKSRNWEHDRNFVRDFYSLIVGAYLGCVLEANLGGEWEPSEHYVASRLRIGGRAYYPFQRAQQCLHGVHIRVLRYSLYHYYREIERALSVP